MPLITFLARLCGALSRRVRLPGMLGTVAALMLLAWPAGPAHAACSGGVLVSATPMAFGFFSGQARTTTGTLSLTCTGSGNTNFSIALSAGNSGSFATRQLRNGSANLSYNLFTTSACSQLWGNGTGGSVTVSGQFSLQGQPSQTLQRTIHGCLPAQSVPNPGLYRDTIVVTVTF
jgi:spore coat protein U-like protein